MPPEGGMYRYGNGFAFQAGPTTVGVFVNLRFGGFPVGDFEAGMDVVLFDDLSEIDEKNAMAVTRSERYVREDGAKRVIIKHTPKGGFVPYGARRADGSPHPAAGTGFLLGSALDFPMYGDGYYMKEDKVRDMDRTTEINHLAYDGQHFTKVETEGWPAKDPKIVSGWKLFAPGLSTAIPDGDDLLYAMEATQGNVTECWPKRCAAGVARWRYIEGRWRPVDFVPVAGSRPVENPDVVTGQVMDEVWVEPSVVRDADGSLLMTARGCYDRRSETMVCVWRSEDNGVRWSVLLEDHGIRAESPISINTTAEGVPYIFSCPTDHARDQLCVWLLRADRGGLEAPIMVRDGNRQFGPPPKGPVWFMDHPNGQTVRLADGAWRHLLCHRVMDRGEHGGSEPSVHSGFYLEQVATPGKATPTWRF